MKPSILRHRETLVTADEEELNVVHKKITNFSYHNPLLSAITACLFNVNQVFL